MEKRTWVIEDHLCRKCGGRILRCVTGNGMTPGGNPIFKCADCGTAKSAMNPDVLCWCGMKHKNQHDPAYICLSFSKIEEFPKLRHEFLKCGCDPGQGEVGIVLRDSARNAISG